MMVGIYVYYVFALTIHSLHFISSASIHNKNNKALTYLIHLYPQKNTPQPLHRTTTAKMYTSTLLTTILATLAAAAPSNPPNTRRATYHGVSLSLRITDAFTQPAEYEPAPVEINVLTNLGNTSASEIKFDGSSSNVDINSVECRAYKDAEGQIPGSAPFTLKSPAELSTNLVEVGSVLCYIVTEAESS